MSVGSPLLCEAIRSQLLVIDIQQRLAGAMPEQPLQQVIKHTGMLLQASQWLGIPVMRSEQYPKGLGETLPEIAEQLPEQCDTLEKTCFSCQGAEGFDDVVNPEGRNQIIITGMESHVCVLQTAIQLQDQGNQVFVVSDAICARQKTNHQNALQRLQQADVVVTNTESVLFEWLRDAKHEHFKSVSALVR